MKRQPLKSASSSKIGAAGASGRKGETRADLAKSKSTPKVGQRRQQPDHHPEVIQVQELRLVKCLSGADDTLILPAEGDNVLSQADTFPADLDDDDDDDDLISDEEVPDLEDAFVTAVSGKPNKSSMLLTELYLEIEYHPVKL